jgi:hypothetical protein
MVTSAPTSKSTRNARPVTSLPRFLSKLDSSTTIQDVKDIWRGGKYCLISVRVLEISFDMDTKHTCLDSRLFLCIQCYQAFIYYRNTSIGTTHGMRLSTNPISRFAHRWYLTAVERFGFAVTGRSTASSKVLDCALIPQGLYDRLCVA